jgi:hypothetical protein
MSENKRRGYLFTIHHPSSQEAEEVHSNGYQEARALSMSVTVELAVRALDIVFWRCMAISLVPLYAYGNDTR